MEYWKLNYHNAEINKGPFKYSGNKDFEKRENCPSKKITGQFWDWKCEINQ